MKQQPVPLEDYTIVKQLNHRLDSLNTSSEQLAGEYNLHQRNLEGHQKGAKVALNDIKENIEELKEAMHNLKEAVYGIGHQLRDKVSKRDLELLQERLDALPLEHNITKEELQRSYDKYASVKE